MTEVAKVLDMLLNAASKGDLDVDVADFDDHGWALIKIDGKSYDIQISGRTT